ncbi:MAG: F0F1-type synthase, alpha subunit [Actinomycetia bacterium]|nr:F0F1-type synthase, alpha subunit [Actinomycetes bacterium]
MLAALFSHGISELFSWKPFLFGGTPFAFNKVALLALVSTVMCSFLFIGGSRKRALVPSGIQNVAEAGYELVENSIGVEVMGEQDGRKWAPFLAALFFWIFFINIWEVIPGIQFPATSRIAIPMYLALQTWIIFIVVGFKAQGPKYVFNSIFPPGVPKFLYVLVAPIELVSIFIVRPFSLAVRLFANMVAGHVLLTVFTLMCIELLKANSGAYQIAIIPLPFFMLVAMTGFEILVAVLQAYIFTILTAVYVGEALHPAH